MVEQLRGTTPEAQEELEKFLAEFDKEYLINIP
jgi:hypothetical protein